MRPLSPEARHLLEAARSAEGPSPADKARIHDALRQRLADPAAPEPDLGPELAGASSSVLQPALVGATAGAVAGALLLGWWATAPQPWASDREPRPLDRGPGVERFVQIRTVPGPVDEAAPDRETRAALARTPSAPSAESAEPPDGVDRSSRLGAEAELVRSLQRALRDGAWERALELSARHRREFANGLLEEERLAAEVIASCQGRAADREATARRELRERHPGSVHWERIEEACRN